MRRIIITTVFESYSRMKEVVNAIFYWRVAVLFVVSASHRQGHSSIPDQSVVDLWCTKLHWDRLFSEYYGFILVTIVPPMLRTHILFIYPRRYVILQGGSNMTETDLYVNKPHCAAAVRPWESKATTSTLPPARVRTCSVLSGSC